MHRHLETHHSTVELVDGGVRKVIEPNYDFSVGGREALLGNIIHYRGLLAELGIPVASDYNLAIEDGQLIEYTQNCGPDGFRLIQDGREPERIVGKIAQAIERILTQDVMRVTIDPHPANWCFLNGSMFYIDFHPPRYLQGSTYLVGFPQPTSERELAYSMGRYYSPLGIIRSLRFSAIRAGGRRMEAVLETEINKYPSQLRHLLQDGLADLPERQFRQGGNVRQILANLDIWHIDDVREIALIIADGVHDPNDARTFLGQVLELTRGDFNRPLAQRVELLEQAKQLILARAA